MFDHSAASLLMMKVAVVQVIDVALMLDSLVAATLAVPVFMFFVNCWFRHR